MYTANEARYDTMPYRRCGKSGLKLSALSLGLWHNFGDESLYTNCREMVLGAFDLGITHFDIANNYGPRFGTAEETFGRILRDDLKAYRDQLVVSTKAGYDMWPGPYGDWGSKKYLISSCNQSLTRLGVDYVDIFYHHRPDPETPLEETMDALAQLVRSGKALYVGISNYSGEDTRRASEILKGMGVHLLVHQVRYNMLDRAPETNLFPVLEEQGMGAVAFCPLAQGLLTSRYFGGVPKDSRAGGPSVFLKETSVSQAVVEKARKLDAIAQNRGQSLVQMVLAWSLRSPVMASLIIGASRLSQIQENVQALDHLNFSADELSAIEAILAG